MALYGFPGAPPPPPVPPPAYLTEKHEKEESGASATESAIFKAQFVQLICEQVGGNLAANAEMYVDRLVVPILTLHVTLIATLI
jgi:hypothetical protein